MDASEWQLLWRAAAEINSGFEPGVVFIGGVAVYAHAMSSRQFAGLAAFSHDVDLLISVADYTDLKDIEQVVTNRRLNKSQFYKNGFEFDVYVEDHYDLCVPYAEAAAASVLRFGMRVACLEHLLALKLVAFADRRGSAKGDKDADDLFTLLLLASETPALPATAARIEDIGLAALAEVCRSDAALRVASGNRHLAAQYRRSASAGLQAVRQAQVAAIGLLR